MSTESSLPEGHPWKPVADDLDEVFKDAERWAYVRDYLAQRTNLRPDGSSLWRVVPPPIRHTRSFTEAIDLLIRESECQKTKS